MPYTWPVDPTIGFGSSFEAPLDVKQIILNGRDMEARIGVLEVAAPTKPAGAFDITLSPYNAPTNGVSDAAAGIQAAIDAAATAYITDGQQRVVWYPAGTYIINSALNYKTGVTHRGAGKDITFVKSGTSRTDALIGGLPTTPMFQPNTTAGTVHNVVIEQMTIDQRTDIYDASADSTDAWCISIEATHRTVIQDCYFRNIRTMAVWCDSLDANPTTNHIFQRNHVFNASGDGFSLFGAARGIYVWNNIVENTEDDGIAFQSSTGNQCRYVEAIGNQVLNCTGRTTYGSTPRGVLFQGVLHGKAINNNIFHIYGAGIYAYDLGAFITGDLYLDDNVVNGTHIGYPGVGAAGAQGAGIWVSAAATTANPVYIRRNVLQNIAAGYNAIELNASTNIVTV